MKGTPYQEWLRNGVALVSAIAAFVVNFRDARARATARARTTKVDEELKKKAG